MALAAWELGDGFTLRCADIEEFSRFHAFYRPNVWMHDSLEDRMNRFCADAPCRFIEKDGRRVGGALAGDGELGEIFLIPPFTDRPTLVRRLAEHVKGQTRGRIFSQAVLTEELDDYHRAGFRLTARIAHELTREPDYSWQFMRIMVRPVQRMVWEREGITLRGARKSDARKIGALLEAAYAGSDPQRQTQADFARDIEEFFAQEDKTCRAASSLAWQEGQLIGACLVVSWEGNPLIFDVAVHPQARMGGVARSMIARAIDSLERAGQTQIRLFLECGNPAESLYHALGFIAGPAVASMYLD